MACPHCPPADYVPSPLTASERLLSAAQAAAQLGVSKASVYKAIDRGELEARRIGRAVRIPAAQLSGFGQPRPPVPVREYEFPSIPTTRTRPYNRIVR